MSNLRCIASRRSAAALVALTLLSPALAGTVAAASKAPAVRPTAGARALACRPLTQTNSTQLIDFNDPTMASRLQIVEDYHFNGDVRALRKGQSSSVPGDLDFVLRAVPNHYEALAAMGRWQNMNGPPRNVDGNVENAECYFLRAIAFRPGDARLHAVYGVFLHQSRRLQDAKAEYVKAEEMGADDAELQYNMGLLMYDLGDFPKAREYAEKAYAQGYPLPGLRNKLRQQQHN